MEAVTLTRMVPATVITIQDDILLLTALHAGLKAWSTIRRLLMFPHMSVLSSVSSLLSFRNLGLLPTFISDQLPYFSSNFLPLVL